MQYVKLKIDGPPRYLQALNSTLLRVQAEFVKLGINKSEHAPAEKLLLAIFGTVEPSPSDTLLSNIAILALRDKAVLINGAKIDATFEWDGRDPLIVRISWYDDEEQKWYVDLDLRNTHATRRVNPARY